jgi:sulfonate transport system substrate-binding protein
MFQAAGAPLLDVASLPPYAEGQANLVSKVSSVQTITGLKGKKIAM